MTWIFLCSNIALTHNLQVYARLTTSTHFSPIAKITHDPPFICRSNEYGLPQGLTESRYCVPVGTPPDSIRVNGSDDMLKRSAPRTSSRDTGPNDEGKEASSEICGVSVQRGREPV
jgi:hypothetical protein